MSRNHQECLVYLEQVRWQGKPRCPYCNSTNATPIQKENRYHCNECFNSYSVIVGTLFHKTHLDLSVWFQAIALILQAKRGVSVRQLARIIDVNKNTAASMITRIEEARSTHPELLKNIVDFYHDKKNDR